MATVKELAERVDRLEKELAAEKARPKVEQHFHQHTHYPQPVPAPPLYPGTNPWTWTPRPWTPRPWYPAWYQVNPLGSRIGSSSVTYTSSGAQFQSPMAGTQALNTAQGTI
jgi:hypothetical protein